MMKKKKKIFPPTRNPNRPISLPNSNNNREQERLIIIFHQIPDFHVNKIKSSYDV